MSFKVKQLHMSRDNNLQFISQKISQLRTAILYSMSNELIRLPNCIAMALKVDEEGYLWFVCDKPAHQVEQCADTFPVKLHFYKKGVLYHVEVNGTAQIVNNDYKGDSEFAKPLLLKMDMASIEYTETGKVGKRKAELFMEKAFHWVVSHIAIPRPQKSVLHQLQAMNRQ